jgi:hypothetical protein
MSDHIRFRFYQTLSVICFGGAAWERNWLMTLFFAFLVFFSIYAKEDANIIPSDSETSGKQE